MNYDKENPTSLSRPLIWALVAYCYFEVLAGPIRWLEMLIGLPYFHYLPSAIAVTGMVLSIGGWTRRNRLGGFGLIALVCIVGLLIAAALLGDAPAIRIGMGLYSLLPLFVGVFAMDDGMKLMKYHAPLLWVLAVAGVGIQYLGDIQYPWNEMSYSVMGIERIFSESMWVAGDLRLSGFSGNNFACAFQVGLYGLLALIGLRGGYLVSCMKAGIFIFSALAIMVTTTKSALGAFLVVSIVLATSRIPHVSVLVRWSSAIIVTVALVALPAATLVGWSWESEAAALSSKLSGETLRIRVNEAWPEAWNLMAEDDNPFVYVIGRGIGGIGLAQRTDWNETYNPADNYFVYMIVTGGFLGLLLFAWSILQGVKLIGAGRDDWLVTGLFMFSVGITMNLIEAPMFGLVLGMLMGGATADQLPKTA